MSGFHDQPTGSCRYAESMEAELRDSAPVERIEAWLESVVGVEKEWEDPQASLRPAQCNVNAASRKLGDRKKKKRKVEGKGQGRGTIRMAPPDLVDLGLESLRYGESIGDVDDSHYRRKIDARREHCERIRAIDLS